VQDERGIDESGKLVGLHIRVSGQSINALLNPAIKEGKTRASFRNVEEPATRSSAIAFRTCGSSTRCATLTCRSALARRQHNQNGVYLECFVEECARAAGADSLEFRRAMMQSYPKHLAC